MYSALQCQSPYTAKLTSLSACGWTSCSAYGLTSLQISACACGNSMPGFSGWMFTFLHLTRTCLHSLNYFTSFRGINYRGDRADFINCVSYFNGIGHLLEFLPTSSYLIVSDNPASPYRGSKSGSSHLQSGQNSELSSACRHCQLLDRIDWRSRLKLFAASVSINCFFG